MHTKTAWTPKVRNGALLLRTSVRLKRTQREILNMLIQRANKYCADPSPYQAQAMGQWVGACRHEYNHTLERRQYEYRNYGFSLAYVSQAKELTGRRAAVDWLDFAPVHALQNALRDLDEAFSRFFKGIAGYPKPRKKFKNDSFTLPGEDVEPAPYTSLRCPKANCGHCSPNNRPTRDLFRCEVCGFEEHARHRRRNQRKSGQGVGRRASQANPKTGRQEEAGGGQACRLTPLMAWA
jgi:hypothetical protein